MKFSNTAIVAVALALSNECSANDTLDSILANWAFGSAEPTDPFAAPQPEPEPEPQAPPAASEPETASNLDDALSAWAAPPEAADQPMAEEAAGGGEEPNLEDALAAWAAGTPVDQPTEDEEAEAAEEEPEVIQNNIDVPAIQAPAAGGGVTGDTSTNDILANWGFANDEPLEPVVAPQPVKVEPTPVEPIQNNGGNDWGKEPVPVGGGWGKPPANDEWGKPDWGKPPANDEWGKPPPKRNDELEFILDNFHNLGMNEEPGDPTAGYGYGPGKQHKLHKEKEDISEILNNFHEGEREPWMGGGTGTGKKDHVDEIIEEYYPDKTKPGKDGHPPKYDPMYGHPPVEPPHPPKTKPVYYPPQKPKDQQKDVIDHIVDKYYKKGDKKQKPDYYPPADNKPPPMPEHPIAPPHPLPPMGGAVCIDRSLEAKRRGLRGRECVGRNQAICRNGVQFGIKSSDIGNSTTYFVEAWYESDPLWSVYSDFATAVELCVGDSKRRKDTAYMTVRTEKKMYYLVCPEVGKSKKKPKLKIPNQRADVIVKFRRGAGDKDTLWQINHDGTDLTNPRCTWEHVPLHKPQMKTEEKPMSTNWMPAQHVP